MQKLGRYRACLLQKSFVCTHPHGGWSQLVARESHVKEWHTQVGMSFASDKLFVWHHWPLLADDKYAYQHCYLTLRTCQLHSLLKQEECCKDLGTFCGGHTFLASIAWSGIIPSQNIWSMQWLPGLLDQPCHHCIVIELWSVYWLWHTHCKNMVAIARISGIAYECHATLQP